MCVLLAIDYLGTFSSIVGSDVRGQCGNFLASAVGQFSLEGAFRVVGLLVLCLLFRGCGGLQVAGLSSDVAVDCRAGLMAFAVGLALWGACNAGTGHMASAVELALRDRDLWLWWLRFSFRGCVGSLFLLSCSVRLVDHFLWWLQWKFVFCSGHGRPWDCYG